MNARSASELLESAIQASIAAGRVIMEVYGGHFEVEHKSDLSPLTEADKRAHKAILEHLSGTHLPLLSEEEQEIPYTARSMWQRYWLVDPLDGTKEFVKRNGEFTVNIALMEQPDRPVDGSGIAIPLGGVIYAPAQDLLYYAWTGGGAYRLEHAATYPAMPAYERAAMSTRLPLSSNRSTYTILASRSHRDERTEAFIRDQQVREGEVELAFKGSALKFGLMAEGTADVYPRFAPTMEWDTAAGQIICNEAGREVTDVSTGKPMRYNKQDLMNNWFIVQ
jgi:3'(2'), 5'-bisphosphate nucleotidase